MFMFELPRIKHVGWIAFHKVSLARFKGVGSEKYLKFVLISKRVSSKMFLHGNFLVRSKLCIG